MKEELFSSMLPITFATAPPTLDESLKKVVLSITIDVTGLPQQSSIEDLLVPERELGGASPSAKKGKPLKTAPPAWPAVFFSNLLLEIEHIPSFTIAPPNSSALF
ncbi:MAG: hypothetical protein AAFQ02_12065, partial [Bacteroidota bacterium]